jgi:hypothetical protein
MSSLLLTIAALGLSIEASAQSVPNVDAQLYRASVDGDGFVTTDTARGMSEGFLLRTSLGVGTGLLAYQPPRGPTKMLLSSASELDVVAAYALGPARLGVIVPVVYTAGVRSVQGAGLGNLGVDGRLTVLDGRVGFALTGRLGLPTRSLDVPVGDDSLAGEASAVLQAVEGPLTIATNVGVRFGEQSKVLGGTWKDQLVVRLGIGLPVTDTFGLSTELNGRANLGTFGTDEGGVPMELMVGSWVQPTSDWRVHLGLGRGISSGIGASQFRAVAMAEFRPEAASGDRGARITERDAAREARRVAAQRTNEAASAEAPARRGKGLPVTLEVVSATTGALLDNAQLVGAASKSLGEGAWTVSLSDDPVSFDLYAPGYRMRTVTLEDEEASRIQVELEPVAELVIVQVDVRDGFGGVIDDGLVTIGGGSTQSTPARPMRLALAPGVHRVLIEAPGFGPAYEDLVVTAGQVAPASFVLGAPQVVFRPGAIDLKRPLSVADVELQRALLAEVMVRPGVRGIRLVGDAEVAQAVMGALIGLGYSEKGVSVAPVDAGAPERGIFDVVVAR